MGSPFKQVRLLVFWLFGAVLVTKHGFVTDLKHLLSSSLYHL